jgi:carboxypeptidase C (cathepsin A)
LNLCGLVIMLAAALLLASGVVAGASIVDYGTEALKDEIHNLPGAPKVSWRTFSGYIDVSAPGETAGSRKMFYWFVESQNSPKTDPVMLWTNGGPGCTGLGGFLSEQGPFRATKNGESLELNDFSWTKVANMVFIEQPVGVGFSTTDIKIEYGDDQAAADNHRFVVGFFKRYPQYASQDFYISSESYGGHYMPTLARKLKQAANSSLAVPQFRGVFLGNPLTYMMYRNYGQYGTAWGHQLLPEPLWKKYEAAKCKTTFPPSSACAEITDQMDSIMANFDLYALDFDTCTTEAAAGRHERWTMRSTILRANADAQGSDKARLAAEAPYEPCSSGYYTAYLNRADVQAAIHVKKGAKWEMCSNEVSQAYNITDVNTNMVPVWKELVRNGDLNIMILSGDDDSICASLGTQQFIWDMGYAPKSDHSWVAWKVDGQVAGFQTDFAVPSGEFSFATVHSAGHMVPATQPARSLALVKSFLSKDKLNRTIVVV